ncbi:jg7666, partial [Pararge aegeria aegeria]
MDIKILRNRPTFEPVLISVAVNINQVEVLPPPKEAQAFQHEVSFSCDACAVEQ